MKRLLITLWIAILCSGCGTTAKFVYPTNYRNLVVLAEKPRYEKVVAVTPFEEMRGDKNLSSTYWLYLVPLMPFGYGEYQRPEAARMFNTIAEFDFDVTEDLAKAAATSIRRSGLFKDCYFTFGGEKSNADLLLTGEVQSTTYNGTLYTYGLSVEGPLLWFLAFPLGSSENELTIRFEMRDAITKEKIWEYSFDKRKKILQGLYYNMGHDVKGYSELMENAMNEALVDLDKTLQTRFGTSSK